LVPAAALVAAPATKNDKATPKGGRLVVFYSTTSTLQVVKPFPKAPQVSIAQAGCAVDLAWEEYVPSPHQVFGGASESHLDPPAKELDVDASHV
jgi:hypothetical protein